MINILSWDAVPEKSSANPDAIPMSGGYLSVMEGEQKVISLAINSNLLCKLMVNGTRAERENLFEIACRFAEDRIKNKTHHCDDSHLGLSQ